MTTAPAVSLKVMAERKDEGVQKNIQYQIDPRKIEVEDGFNARPIDQSHVQAFKASILAGAFVQALDVRVEVGRVIVVDGHHRLAAYMELIADGHDIKRVDCRQFRGNDADRVAHMLTSAQGKALTPLQMGIQYRKLIGFGWTEKEIAAKVGKSSLHVADMVLLAMADSDVVTMVKKKEVAAHTAVKAVKAHGSGAGKVLAGKLVVAKAKGKNKVTATTGDIKNEHGLDVKYCAKKIRVLLRSIHSLQPDELAAGMRKLADDFEARSKHLTMA